MRHHPPAMAVEADHADAGVAPLPPLRLTDALPDSLFAVLLLVGALGAVDVPDDWVASLLDLALFEVPIQFGVSVAIGCALAVRGLRRSWLVLPSAVLGWAWAVGVLYWHELSSGPIDRVWPLLTATSAVFLGRWGVAWRYAPADRGLDQRGSFAIIMLPYLQSAIFYSALVVAALTAAAIIPNFYHIEVDLTASQPRLAVLACAYAARAIVCLPPIAMRMRRRLARRT